ncbi:MAG TPA: bifunctional (p)ppGpp synthetase/guanosine-3',5'-bis(diphosphate) 3'-pyrophosphohydrolase [Gaiellaceae bacterium]|nr:bifunctional (p)ppGpp synthetase/guanosine-3',5'-bis(diphosphate) 3'-pyrophosphohydrolase [Gaiellaceae bacterium]
MTVLESRERHQELIDELIETVAAYNRDVDRDLLARAFTFAARAHEGQQRRSGEDFIHHPWGAAKICAELRLDEQTIAAALLHDVVEDTETTLDDVRAEFGDEIAQLVDGVTKLTRIQFQSREQAEAENYRKMIVAMAQDVRVILIKLADRLHNLRTIEYLGKQKQVQKAKETLEVYAPLAHRLGINKLKWELEDLAFSTLHPRKYEEIKAMVSERRADREEHVREAAMTLQAELEKVDIPADISGRAKHFYSIYDKMAKKGREFNEIYDLTAMRVIVERSAEEGARDCYGALGLIHSLWKPMPGRFKDYVAMPKLNGYQALHTTVIGPEGRPLEIQVRTREMHETAEFGVAAHWLYKHGRKGKGNDDEWAAWVRQLMDWQEDEADPREFIKTFRTDLFEDEVYVFTPKGEVKALPAGSTPIDFAYAVHTDVGHRTVGAKINGRIVPLHYRLKSGDFVEILTTKSGRGPSRDWLSLAASSRARNKIRQWFSRTTREETEQKGRETLEAGLKKQNLPYRKLQGSSVLAQVIRESGYKKAEDFYLALGSGKLQPSQIVNKVIQRLKTEEVAEEETVPLKAPRARHATSSGNVGIAVSGIDDVLVRLAKCCTPLPGDRIVGYVSLGKGITIHREDCSNVKALRRNPERFTPVAWDGGASKSFRVQIAVDSWDRPRLLEDVARTFSEHGANIVEYGGHVEDQLAKNWYVAEVGDVKELRSLLTALRNVDAVFDAYRVTPS